MKAICRMLSCVSFPSIYHSYMYPVTCGSEPLALGPSMYAYHLSFIAMQTGNLCLSFGTFRMLFSMNKSNFRVGKMNETTRKLLAVKIFLQLVSGKCAAYDYKIEKRGHFPI